jgi:hypothetical protein
VLGIDEAGLVLAVSGGSIRIQKLRGFDGKVAAKDSGLVAGDHLS